MLVTEHEAKRKGCVDPIVSDGLQRVLCEGSECMAWRWANKTVHVDGEMQTIKVGYCGKAGKPE